jgi:Mycothiol maleylpyruvate isomerase N-terminal domain
VPTRAEILDTLAASQAQVMTFFQGLSQQDLERPATASEFPGGSPWRAKDHFAHLVKNERNIQGLLRDTLAGEPRDALLRAQYPAGMEMPSILGDLDALTPQEKERLVIAIASLNQNYVKEHHDDSLERLVADYLAGRQETLNLMQQFTDEQLAALVPTVGSERNAADMFVLEAGHATTHIT